MRSDRRLVSTLEWLVREWRADSQGFPVSVDPRVGISLETLFLLASINRDYANEDRSRTPVAEAAHVVTTSPSMSAAATTHNRPCAEIRPATFKNFGGAHQYSAEIPTAHAA